MARNRSAATRRKMRTRKRLEVLRGPVIPGFVFFSFHQPRLRLFFLSVVLLVLLFVFNLVN